VSRTTQYDYLVLVVRTTRTIFREKHTHAVHPFGPTGASMREFGPTGAYYACISQIGASLIRGKDLGPLFNIYASV
jgi:hypothetical protein